jgi:hypothetical protein
VVKSGIILKGALPLTFQTASPKPRLAKKLVLAVFCVK